MKERLPLHPTNQSDPVACRPIWTSGGFLLLPIFCRVEYFQCSTDITSRLRGLTELLSYFSLKTSALTFRVNREWDF